MTADFFRRNMTYDEAPKGSKNEDWVPGETEAHISAAIDRVRRDYAMQDERDGAFVWEWWHNNRPSTPAEEIGVMRRLHRRAQTLAEYHAEPALPEPRRAFSSGTPLTPKICANPECRITFLPRVAAAKYHDPACQRRAQRIRDRQKQEAAS